MRKLSIVFYAGMATLALAAAACGDGGGGGTKTNAPSQSEIEVRLTEYSVTPVVSSVPAGQVTFDARNIGGSTHELVVFKTDLEPDALPTAADGSVDETGAGITLVGEAEDIASQTQRSFELELGAGSYVLLCNVVEEVNGQTVSHYQKAMHAAFTVE